MRISKNSIRGILQTVNGLHHTRHFPIPPGSIFIEVPLFLLSVARRSDFCAFTTNIFCIMVMYPFKENYWKDEL